MNNDKLVKPPILKLYAFLLFIFVAGFTACSDLNLNDTEGAGMMNIHLSDATDASKGPDNGKGGPPDKTIEGLEEVNIDIQELRVRFLPSHLDTISADSIVAEPGPEGHAKWITLPLEPVKINLLDLSSADSLVTSAELEEGFYSEIRLILGNDNDVVVDGEVHPLKVPSGQQSGYKIKLGEPLHSGEIMDLTIEFDAEKSVKVTGNGQYMLHPVLHVFKGRTNGDD